MNFRGKGGGKGAGKGGGKGVPYFIRNVP